ncbi:ABC transporter ATP-binding protein [Azospirillum picis]|uniref:NitT/TauT family transport system ATP-binding protein n=1 Tax=Azospirillum picis TaxID=488438 RepID=A0ABU0MP07_9PROT|nr:ABC transporter ATP-binding protein [Azospirillum picis]MBP2301756.1 NitT/TauT family transport system ATP-binding protein [Azospirillum picis]MDQ0535069.1 NitT/TauT family transport system ATP-binding protein [Azospirillum picis]
MSFVAIDGAGYAIGNGPAIVEDIDWRIGEGEFHCLVGRSGCGKTTLLKLAAGLLLPTSGSIRIRDRAVSEPSAEVGFVFQAPTLLDWLPVIDNILLPLSLKRRVGPQDRRRAEELLALVAMPGLGARYPRELSGGQQSRVAIARALVTDPALLLFDEPFAALDAITREELQDDLLRLCGRGGTTMLFVTHDIAEAVYLADRVAVMAGGRLCHDLRIDLPRPRGRDVRYAPRFTALCRELRRAMDGGAVAAMPLDAAS